jgi:hypothetical protein
MSFLNHGLANTGQILCSVSATTILCYQKPAGVTAHNNLLPTIDQMCSCTFDLYPGLHRETQGDPRGDPSGAAGAAPGRARGSGRGRRSTRRRRGQARASSRPGRRGRRGGRRRGSGRAGRRVKRSGRRWTSFTARHARCEGVGHAVPSRNARARLAPCRSQCGAAWVAPAKAVRGTCRCAPRHSAATLRAARRSTATNLCRCPSRAAAQAAGPGVNWLAPPAR